MKTLPSLLLTLSLGAAVTTFLSGCHSHNHGASTSAKPYPLQQCLVSGDALDPNDSFVFTHGRQEVKLCCKGCHGDFQKEPAKYLSKLKSGAHH